VPPLKQIEKRSRTISFLWLWSKRHYLQLDPRELGGRRVERDFSLIAQF
jgi:hypothetical protein